MDQWLLAVKGPSPVRKGGLGAPPRVIIILHFLPAGPLPVSLFFCRAVSRFLSLAGSRVGTCLWL